ncbi:MAG: hypothetical protein R2911_35875 [Caldilineaceae bacterium]
MAGPLTLAETTRDYLVRFAQSGGDLVFGANGTANGSSMAPTMQAPTALCACCN